MNPTRNDFSATSIETVSSEMIARRKSFAETLCRSLALSTEQWRPIQQLLAYTESSQFNMYFFFPYLFREAFLTVDPAAYKTLAWSGRIALDYIVLYDYLLDHDHSADPTILLSSYKFQREYITSLSPLFPTDSPFWEYLDRFEQEAGQALLYEYYARQTADGIHDQETFQRIATGKAALSRLAIIGLGYLSGHPEDPVVNNLIESIDLYNCARQVIDDMLDWRSDYQMNRPSFLVTQAIKQLPANYQNNLTEQLVGTALYHYAAIPMLTYAHDCLSKAIDISPDCPLWIDLLQAKSQSILDQRYALVSTLERQSKKNRTSPHRQRSLTTTIQHVVDFLHASQDDDGCWRDFATAAGESEDWITAYVGWVLARHQLLNPSAKQRTIEWLLNSQFPDGGWGYRKDVVVDADSTAWGLRFMQQVGHGQSKASNCKIIIAHQHSSGGMSTYAQAEPIRSWMGIDPANTCVGWCTPQMGVTAVAASALLESGIRWRSAAHRALNYLLTQQQPNGSWRSYWWGGPYYATSQTLQLIYRVHKRQTESAAQALNWLASKQKPDGSWGLVADAPGNAFTTALALQGIGPYLHKNHALLAAVQKGVRWLIDKQTAEGSWHSSALLLLPEPEEVAPWNIQIWPVSILGTGIARQDHRRLFTSATTLNALAQVAPLFT